MARTLLITNMCPHYRVKLFEALHRSTDIEFVFYAQGVEKYWNSMIPTESGGFAVRPFPKQSRGMWSLISGIRKLIHSKEYDVVVGTSASRVVLVLCFLFAKTARKPIIIWTGNWKGPDTWLRKVAFPVLGALYRRCDAMVAYGMHVKEHLKDLGVPSDRIYLGWQTVNNELFNRTISPEEVAEVRQSLGLNPADRLILNIGRLVPEKGQVYLLEALSILNDPSVVLLIIGNGPLRDELQHAIEKVGVRCSILEYVPNKELTKYIASSDIFAFPSITTKTFKEPWGLVVNEVMNQGVPIVTTDAVGAAVGGLLQDGKHGYVVPERSASELANKLQTLLDSPHLRKTMGDEARQEISRWTYDRMAKGFIKAIRSVQVRQGTPRPEG